jgi:hypothetical protein
MTEIGYKLTDQKLQTYGGFQWTIGRVRMVRGGEGGLCSKQWLHYYRDPLLAVLHNPIHADIPEPRLLEVQVGGRRKHDGWVKSGCTWMRPVREIDVPEIATAQRVAYGILCARKVYDLPVWRQWADRWLSGEDRTVETARDVRAEVGAAAEAAARAVARAAWSAEAATAEAAARAAARAAAEATWAVAGGSPFVSLAARAAWAAAWAAAAAADLDLRVLARKAMEVK